MGSENDRESVLRCMTDAELKAKIDKACLKFARLTSEQDLADANEERRLEGLPPFESKLELVREFREWAENRYRRTWH